MEKDPNILVAYRSIYGHSRSYAEWLSEDLAAELVDLAHQPHPDLSSRRVTVFVLPIYGGGFLGAKEMAKLAGGAPSVSVVAVTVGASDPTNAANLAAYGKSAEASLPKAMLARMQWFHLRGGLDYPRMKWYHRAIMWLVTQKAKQDARKGDAEAQEMADSFGKVVDFRDRTAIAPVVEYVRTLIRDAA